MKISIIAAIGPNRELGKDNKLLWHIPEDLKRFKDLTMGKVVIMGRKTYESLRKPLSNRINIIITRNQNRKLDKCLVVNSLEEAMEKSKASGEAFIIGGGEIYKQALPYAQKLYLTIVEGQFEADTFFPDYSEFKKIVFQRKGESNGYKYTLLELVR
jgi:dihydrofolate reductase